jgi:hypothetical protein
MLPALQRLDIDDMVEGRYYFILHAPRQSGKTTCIAALANKINSEGRFYALKVSLSQLRAIGDRDKGLATISELIDWSMKISPVGAIRERAYTYGSASGMGHASSKVWTILNCLCNDLDRDLVVFFDEADCISPDPLIGFLSQIREGYMVRDETPPFTSFPRSIALVGMRDISYHLASVRPETDPVGIASPFNVKKESISLSNFTRDEILALYSQHTELTGQVFTAEAVDRAWYWSDGQPWLASALADNAVEIITKRSPSVTITGEMMDIAADNVIKRRDPHLDSLFERLKEPRVIRVMDSVFSGNELKVATDSDDFLYCLDLGIVKLDGDRQCRPANPIYREVFSRRLADQVQDIIGSREPVPVWTDGTTVMMSALLKGFQDFWRREGSSAARRNPDILATRYDESTFVIILLAYLQRAVNSGASVFREYSAGRRAVDISLIYRKREYLVEVKHEGNYRKSASVSQLARYLRITGENEGWLVVFERSQRRRGTMTENFETVTSGGLTINILRCRLED